MLVRGAWCIAGVLLVGCAGARTWDGIEGEEVDIDLRLERARLDSVLDAIGSAAKVRLLVADPETGAREVTLRADDLTWQGAVARVASAAGCSITRTGAALELEPIPAVTVQGTVPVVRALELIGAPSGVEIEVEPGITGRRVTLDLKALPWDEALVAVVHAAGLHTARVGDKVRVAVFPIPGETPSARPAAHEEAADEDAPRHVIALPAGSGAARDPGFPIDLDVEDVDLRTVLAGIGEMVGVPIRLEEGKEETLSLALSRVPWREAIDAIARLSGCEVVDQPGGGLLLQASTRLTVGFTDTPALTVLQLLAGFGELDLVVGVGVPLRRITVDWRAPDFLGAVEAVGRATGLSIERRGRVILVSDRPGWGTADLDGRPPAPPARPGVRTPLRVRARGAPLPVLLQLLAAESGRDLVAAELPRRGVDLWLEHTPAHAALDELIESAGIQATLEGNVLLVHGVERGSGSAGGHLVATLKPPGRDGFAIALQATLVAPPDSEAPSRAIIDGQVYREGDALRDPEGGEIHQVGVVRIDARGVLFRVGVQETLVPF